MSDLPRPTAARLARPRWLDTRLVVGVLLVLGSVVAGARLLAAADDTVPVWAAVHDLGAGTRLAAGDVVRRDVRLDGDLDRYLPATGEPPAGQVVVRPVGQGELVPAGAVAAAGGQDLRRLAVEVDQVSTAALPDRAVVDVWVVPEPASGVAAGPVRSEVVLTDVTVDAVDERPGALGASGTRTGGVVLLVSPDEARRVLDAQARGSLRLLQVPLTGEDGPR